MVCTSLVQTGVNRVKEHVDVLGVESTNQQHSAHSSTSRELQEVLKSPSPLTMYFLMENLQYTRVWKILEILEY